MKGYQVKNLDTQESIYLHGEAAAELVGVELNYIDWIVQQDGEYANANWKVLKRKSA